jgi:hypothetical protein
MTVDKKLAEKAAAALLKHVSNKKDSSNELLSEEQFIWLQVGLSKVPDPKKKAAKMYAAIDNSALYHSIVRSSW